MAAGAAQQSERSADGGRDREIAVVGAGAVGVTAAFDPNRSDGDGSFEIREGMAVEG